MKKHYCRMQIADSVVSTEGAILTASRQIEMKADVTVDNFQTGNELTDDSFKITFD